MRLSVLGACLAVAGSSLVAGQGPAPIAAQTPTLGVVLDRSSKYVAAFQTQMAGIVLEEEYTQDSRRNLVTSVGRAQHRALRSDLLLVKPAGEDRWVQFRDVFEVDGRTVRDRDARLEQLFLKPSSETLTMAYRITEESARYNIGNITRNVNVPVMALMFLDAAYRSRFNFVQVRPGNLRPFRGMVKADDDVWAIEYKETTAGTLIRTTQDRDLPAHGRYWIDAPTGRVLRTELVAEDNKIRGRVDVLYRQEPGIDVLVPGEMREEYFSMGVNARILGKAVYGKIRRFTVTTEETIKKPGGIG